MEKRKRLVRATSIALIALVGLSAGAALAGYLGSGQFNSRFLDWRFFGTTSANGSYTSPSNSAMSTWTNTTDLQFRKISGNNWDIAQYVANFGATGWAGLAYICDVFGRCNNSSAWNSTFWYCIADENRYYQDGYNSTFRRAVATHEAGHCVSLAHNNTTSSVMYTFISSTGVTNPNSGDRSDVNRRY